MITGATSMLREKFLFISSTTYFLINESLSKKVRKKIKTLLEIVRNISMRKHSFDYRSQFNVKRKVYFDFINILSPF